MAEDQSTGLTAEEQAEMEQLCGGPVSPIVHTPEERVRIERVVQFIMKHGRQPKAADDV